MGDYAAGRKRTCNFLCLFPKSCWARKTSLSRFVRFCCQRQTKKSSKMLPPQFVRFCCQRQPKNEKLCFREMFVFVARDKQKTEKCNFSICSFLLPETAKKSKKLKCHYGPAPKIFQAKSVPKHFFSEVIFKLIFERRFRLMATSRFKICEGLSL